MFVSPFKNLRVGQENHFCIDLTWFSLKQPPSKKGLKTTLDVMLDLENTIH